MISAGWELMQGGFPEKKEKKGNLFEKVRGGGGVETITGKIKKKERSERGDRRRNLLEKSAAVVSRDVRVGKREKAISELIKKKPVGNREKKKKSGRWKSLKKQGEEESARPTQAGGEKTISLRETRQQKGGGERTRPRGTFLESDR